VERIKAGEETDYHFVQKVLGQAIDQWNKIVDEMRERVNDPEFILKVLNEEAQALEGEYGMETAIHTVRKRFDDALPRIAVKGTDASMRYLCILFSYTVVRLIHLECLPKVPFGGRMEPPH